MTLPGEHMRRELAQAPAVFANTLRTVISASNAAQIASLHPTAIYTIARGSSDAAANILSYEFMRELGIPMTSLPPSIFSVGRGVDLTGAMILVVSQSGASNDLVLSAKGARARGATVIGLINALDSPVAKHAHITLPIGAGAERAVPATKSVLGSIAAGMALLCQLSPTYAARAQASTASFDTISPTLPQSRSLLAALASAHHIYVIGRDTGYGAAQELALKLKETCALHAEAYSSSEVLHGPLQLATNPLLILILDTEQPDVQASLNTAEARFQSAGGTTFRLRPSDIGAQNLTPAAAAAMLLCLTYPLVLATALALGHDPDRPETLSKITQTI